MEYYLYYCSEEFAKNQDYEWATLIKIDGSFYYYHEKSGKWVTDTLYDDFCSSFTEDWREKSKRVVETDEQTIQWIIDNYYKKE